MGKKGCYVIKTSPYIHRRTFLPNVEQWSGNRKVITSPVCIMKISKEVIAQLRECPWAGHLRSAV